MGSYGTLIKGQLYVDRLIFFFVRDINHCDQYSGQTCLKVLSAEERLSLVSLSFVNISAVYLNYDCLLAWNDGQNNRLLICTAKIVE